MDIGLIAFTAAGAVVIAILLWLIFHSNSEKSAARKKAKKDKNNPLIHLGMGLHGKEKIDPYSREAEAAVKAVFNDDFREELRNRGRLHFEKIINDNAMFLQQDLQLTTAQLNDYMKQEIINKLQVEFKKYEQSIGDAKQLALDSITKTQTVLEAQRAEMTKEVRAELARDKDQLVNNFEAHMAEIINHYVLLAIGDQIDLTSQLDFILADLEANKQAIIEDIKDGA